MPAQANNRIVTIPRGGPVQAVELDPLEKRELFKARIGGWMQTSVTSFRSNPSFDWTLMMNTELNMERTGWCAPRFGQGEVYSAHRYKGSSYPRLDSLKVTGSPPSGS